MLVTYIYIHIHILVFAERLIQPIRTRSDLQFGDLFGECVGLGYEGFFKQKFGARRRQPYPRLKSVARLVLALLRSRRQD